MIPLLSFRASQRRQFLSITALTLFCFCAYSLLRISPKHTREIRIQTQTQTPLEPSTTPGSAPQDEYLVQGSAEPRKVPIPGMHPIGYLTRNAQEEFGKIKARQSKTLEEAVQEYRRRYGIPPPPLFDEWFRFAKDNDVKLIDEFDTIHDLITPFWGLKPKTIRARAREALGFDNGLIGVSIRDHKITYIQNGVEWQQNATKRMMGKFLKYLPDMDLAFNFHDESRVILSHEDLTRLVRVAKEQNMPAAVAKSQLANDFTQTNSELYDGKSFNEISLTRFNSFAHQSTWSHSRLSCPPDTPARCLEEEEAVDYRNRYGMSDLGFVYNTTAMSDICLSPSLKSNFGFFGGPNTYRIVQDLFPIFSQSKISSYSDLVYPSPWDWAGMVEYDEDMDMEWVKKESKLYWRGSTTGGYSRNGRWRHQHRQRLVQKLNARDQAHILTKQDDPSWAISEVPRGDYSEMIDVHFSHIGQCDQGDCEAQRAFFNVTEAVDQQDAWSYKYLLDMDGNAFSGRFTAFLRSRSLTFKLAVFREWHAEWLKPWAHYVPLSIQGDDWLETVRFFESEEAGHEEGERIAAVSREWANQALRQVDMEAWFFRLMLEYARVIDDKREAIGYDRSSANMKLPKVES
ncbi:glycosyl transferase family 90-domain-containing protein [Fusarium sp. MPI-SDFR-AT-0072]|nr:glycosyl transferase family 90-domain-containing protein [Fusarium sp. MPI-SDFR-AT-0072]